MSGELERVEDAVPAAGMILLAARNYLATGKWCKGTMADGDGNRCALGALLNANRSKPASYWKANSALEQYIGPEYACFGMLPVAAFNDHPDITLADVLNLFDKALAERGRLGEVQ